MSVLTLSTARRKKAVLTSLAFLMMNTLPGQALDFNDYNNGGQYYPAAGQMAGSQAFQSEQFNSQQYQLRGIALFSGTDPVSGVIKGVTHSKISHVGIILSDVNNKDQWYCFESTGSAQEVLRGRYPHVRLTPWSIVTGTASRQEYKQYKKDHGEKNYGKEGYSGDISCRLFNFSDLNQPDPIEVTKFVGQYEQASYTRNLTRLIRAVFRLNRRPSSEQPRTLFCSQLTALMLMNLGILKAGIPANYIPRDFRDKEFLPLLSGITLSPEIKMKSTYWL